MPNKKPAFESVAAKLLVYFIENPDEELTTSDVRVKFGGTGNSLLGSMRGGIGMGLIHRRCGGPGRAATYSAGPRLLRSLAVGAGRLRGAADGLGR